MQVGGKKVGRGSLKGLSALAKRSKSRCEKLKIEFLAKLGGACGENRCAFVDEIVLETRMKAPLIGVRSWKDVSPAIKEDIAANIMVSHCPPHASCYCYIADAFPLFSLYTIL